MSKPQTSTPVFLLDENAQPDLHAEMRRMKLECVWSREVIGKGAPDPAVMAHAAKHGLIVVTSNVRDYQQRLIAKSRPFICLHKIGGEGGAALRRFRDVFLAALRDPGPLQVDIHVGSIRVHRASPGERPPPIKPENPPRKKRKRRGKPRTPKSKQLVLGL